MIILCDFSDSSIAEIANTNYSLIFKTILFILENQYVPDEDIENISGKIESFSLSGVLETSLDYIQGMEGMQPPVQEPRKAGKRGKDGDAYFNTVRGCQIFAVLMRSFIR